MKSQQNINIARDFSKVPLGRFPDDSPHNGTTFREDFLLPALKAFEKIQIELDGTEGYGSSFLEESFGGLVRLRGFTADELISRFYFVSEEDPSLISEIELYIREASPAKD